LLLGRRLFSDNNEEDEMLKLLKEIWERAWAVIGGLLSMIARLFGYYPPVPQVAHENITPADIADELEQARQKHAAGGLDNPGLETSAALIWGYANAPARERGEIDLGILPEDQRSKLLLMKDIDLARLGTNRVLCMQWHILDGKFPTVSANAPEVPAPSKEDVISNAFMARVRARRLLPEDDIPQNSYGRRL
jgi:hypothetical protein